MVKVFKNFLKEEDGVGTVEIVVIVAVLVGVALIFRKQLFAFVENLMGRFFDADTIDSEAGYGDLDGGEQTK
ncbi:MAG: hypothetical protein MJB12_04795 [Firmicutes bacterium]|nr:hypothetical protein [Bacillota bacterium]